MEIKSAEKQRRRKAKQCDVCAEGRNLSLVDMPKGTAATLCRRCKGWLAESWTRPRTRDEAIDRLQMRYAQTLTQLKLPLEDW